MKRALTYNDSVRWARCLCEIIKTASTMCPASARAAYSEIVSRLQVCSGPALPTCDAESAILATTATYTVCNVSNNNCTTVQVPQSAGEG